MSPGLVIRAGPQCSRSRSTDHHGGNCLVHLGSVPDSLDHRQLEEHLQTGFQFHGGRNLPVCRPSWRSVRGVL